MLEVRTVTSRVIQVITWREKSEWLGRAESTEGMKNTYTITVERT